MNQFAIKTKLNYKIGVVMVLGISLAIIYKGHISASPGTNEPKITVGQDTGEAKKVQVQSAYGKLPLSFIQNNGQVNKKVKFYEKSSGHATFFTKDGVYLSLNHSKSKSASTSEKSESALIKLMPLGANKNPKIVAKGTQEGKINYLVGNDRKKWKTNVPTYQSVVYQQIYPGIDLKFYGNNRQLEYDIIVTPGADPSKVKLAYEGIEGLHVTEEGDLVIELKGDTILQKKPVIYQEIDGKRVDVAGAFKIQPRTTRHAKSFEYGFQVASYDQMHPLLIDPTLIYSTYLGGSGTDTGEDIAVDSSGNMYVTGETGSICIDVGQICFPATAGAFQTSFGLGTTDAYVTKINAAGTALVYSTYLGGSGSEIGFGITVDGLGNAYVTGNTNSTDFPTMNPIQAVNNGGTDEFVTKINTDGTALVYSTYLGGSGGDGFHGSIAVDSSGNAYVTAATSSTDFPTVNPIQAVNNGGNDVFVTKINTSGTALVYSTYLGGSSTDDGFSIAVDSSGNAYVTGATSSTNFPMVNPIQAVYGGGFQDAFVTKINTDGTALVYSTYLGGSDSDNGHGIAVDSSGSAYVAGVTLSTNFPTASPLQATNAGGADIFVTKINADGTALVYSTYLGGNGADEANGIALDSPDNAYVAGFTTSTNFPTVNPIQASNAGSLDAFVTEINAAGTALVYSTYLGGSGSEALDSSIAVDSSGNAYVTGPTSSTNFPTANPLQAANAGGSDAFIAKIGAASTTTTTLANFRILNVAPRVGLPGTTVTISGRGFTGATVVTFNGTPATFTVLNNFVIRATVPVGATIGPVCLTTLSGTVCSAFNFTLPPPVITNFTPRRGAGGATVTIYGRYFAGATDVKFNGTSAAFTVTSNNVIKATVPVGATTGMVAVTTPYGTATSAANFAIP